MATISTLAIKIAANAAPLLTGLRAAGAAVRDFASHVNQSGGALVGLTSKLAGLATSLVGIGSIVAATGFGLKLAADAEQAQVAFSTMLGSGEEAKQVLSDLTGFAASTPFEMPELTDAARMLVAFGTEADQVVPTLRHIGDVSAGIGAPITEIAELFGKARVQGRLFAQDINQLTNRGIPVIQSLAEQFNVSENEVKSLVESGQVNFRHLQQVFLDLTKEGGKFAGMMQAQSQTLAGMWSTAKDNVSLVLRDMMAELAKTLDFKAILQGVSAAAEALKGPLTELLQGLGDKFKGNGDWATSFINGLELIAKGVAYVIDAVKLIGAAWDGSVHLFKTSVAAFLDGLAKMLEGIESALAAIPDWMGGGETDLGSADLRTSAASWRKEAQAAAAEMQDALAAPSTADSVAQFFDQVRNNLQQIPEAAQAAADAMELIELDDSELDPALLARWERMEQAARQVFDSTRNPLEQFQSRIRELQDLWKEGFISGDEFDRAASQARRTLEEAYQPGERYAASVSAGSAEAYSAALRHRDGADQQKPLLNLLQEAKEQTRLAREAARRQAQPLRTIKF